jgi:hypothetical protein
MPVPTSNEHQNGDSKNGIVSTGTNGTAFSSNSRTMSRKVSESSYTHTLSSTQKVTVLRQTVTMTRSKIIEHLAHVNDHYIDSITVESFLEYIECERLTHMPHQGSRFDKVLKWAEFFALQITSYEKAVESFVPESRSASKLIQAACRILIEVCFERLKDAQSNSKFFSSTLGCIWQYQLTMYSLVQITLTPLKRHSQNSTKLVSLSRSLADTMISSQ